MKNKLSFLLLCLVCILSLAACSGNKEQTNSEGSSTNNATSTVKEEEETKKPLDLTGEWKQVDSNSDENYQRATIQDGQMEIYWVNETEETEALYWAGTYVAPEEALDEYTWDSVNDKEKTDTAILASGDDQKTFTYEDGVISYSVSAMGMTQTVKLEKVE